MKYFALLIILLVVAFAWWRFYFFHRSSDRVIVPGSKPVCPADGRILYVEDATLDAETTNPYHQRIRDAFGVEGRWTVVATYLSIFDGHFVRSPVSGTVRLHYVEAVDANLSMGQSFIFAALRRPLPLSHRPYTEKNEFLGVSVESDIRVLLVLMADWWIDQIDAFVADGEQVTRGQVIGRIRMGSQVDMWTMAGTITQFPFVGDKVRAGSTECV